MSKPHEKTIPVEESFAEWRTDPKYIVVYNTLENEFSLGGALYLCVAPYR